MAVALTVGGWFAQAFIQTLIDKASDKSIQLFAESRGFAEDMENLHPSLLEIQIILDEVQSSGCNDTKWKTLIQELKDAAYDAEDLIDEFQYHVLRQKIKGEEEDKAASGSSGFSNMFYAAKIKLLGSSHSLEEDDMRARVRKMQGRLEKIANRMKSIMNVLPPNDRRKQPEVKFQARESCSSPVTDILFGRDKELNQVVEWLLGSANQVEPASGFVNDTFSVLPIVGIGGAGKTTLAQYVHRDDRVQDHFHLKIWVCVSDNFTVQGLTKSMIESVTLKKQYDNMGLEPLQRVLHEHIANKKFLLVLDDVWSDDKRIWEKFCALIKVGAHGSKIIVTTRDKKVSKMVSLVEPIFLHGLDEDAFWQLFKKCSFGTLDPENYPELEDIGRKIARKLKGSPLAAKTLGSVLQSDLCHQHWATIMESDIWKIKQDEDDIMPALHLSYQYLNENLKQCFAFCSLFPKDYKFDKAELVRMWMAEGFINEDESTKRMEDVGSDYFLEFVNRSFFQEFRYGLFVMHDLIHDLAEMISAEEICRIQNNRQTKMLSTTRHLRAAVRGNLTLEFSGYDKLRTLVLRTNSPLDSLFEKLRSIRVLHLSGIGLQELSEHIGKLIHLRYLDISWNSEIKILPDSLSDLYNLQTLKVFGCSKLEYIPQELGKLVNLRHIDAYDGFWAMMKDVRRLTNLQELPTFSVQEDDGLNLGQLKDLTQLHGTLHIQNLENVVDRTEAQQAELKNKVHLKQLEFEWSDEKDAKLEEEVIEGLQPHKSLKHLKIEGYNGGRSPSWLMPKVLSNLEKLELVSCKGWDDVLPFIGQRLHLIELCMTDMPALKQLSHEFEGKCFPKLKVLKIINLPAFEEWSWTEGKDLFPCMRELRVSSCPKLKRLPPFPPSLEILTLEDCPSLILNSKTEDNEEAGRHLPPSLKELTIVGCPKLVQLDVEDDQAGSLSSIRKLCVDNTALLKMFPLRNSLPFITELEFVSCSEEVIFVEAILVRSLTAVTSLNFCYCEKLQYLPTELLHCLPFLEELGIYGCPRIQSLSEKGLPPLLKLLYISDCPHIQAMPELEGLHKSLDGFDCAGDVHPTLREQSKKFDADREMRRKARLELE